MFNYKIYILLLSIILNKSVLSQNRGFYDNDEFKKQRHELNFGIGTTNCLTDLGGNYSVSGIGENNDTISNQIEFLRSIYDTDFSKSRSVFSAAYIYHFKNKINFRGNLALATVTSDDAESLDLGRKNRNLNFKSNILEFSGIVELYLLKPSTGTKFNLKDVQGHKLAPKFASTIGFYIMGGVGGFFFNPKAKYNLKYEDGFSDTTPSKWTPLRNLHTEGQGSLSHEEFLVSNRLDTSGVKLFGQKKNGQAKTYAPIALCIPLGFGIEKAFNSEIGIKIEAGYRFTSTDYLDDASGFYASRNDLAAIHSDNTDDALLSQTMSGTQSGNIENQMFFAGSRPEISPGVTIDAPSDGNWVDTDANIQSGNYGAYGPLAYTLDQTSYERGFVRGSPKSNDSYVFINVSFYKKFSTHGKVYKSIHSKEKRRIKASF